MLKRIRNNPFSTCITIFGLYVAWFIIPVFFVDPDPNQHGLSGAIEAIGQWKNQIKLTIILTTVVSILGWWKKIGFTALNRGGLKFLILPVAYILVLLGSVMITNHNASWLFATSSPQQLLALVLVMLGIGFTEETMFRGILFYGLSTRFTILTAVVLSSLFFGSLHYENMLLGASFAITTYQVIHAVAAGFMYIALRLRIGAIWPVMLFHGLWDFCLFNIESLNNAASAPADTSLFIILAIEILPATLYGVFVYWRWLVYNKRSLEADK